VRISATCLFFFSLALQGQQAEITGSVRDRSQAVIPGAVVVARHQATGIERTATSSNEGLYSFPFLASGPYTLEVRATGFQTALQTGVQLEVGQAARLDFTVARKKLRQHSTPEEKVAILRRHLLEEAMDGYRASNSDICSPVTFRWGQQVAWPAYRLLAGLWSRRRLPEVPIPPLSAHLH
jgi:hypothetical protein